MNFACLLRAFIAIAGAAMMAACCHAQPLVYETSLPVAVARAESEGKIVLGDFGTPSCTECQQTARVWDSPSVKRWLQAGTIPWQVDVNTSSAWQPYAADMLGAALPVVVWIDPNNSGTYFFRANGLMSPSIISIYLTNQLAKYLPLMVMNLPGDILTNSSFTVQGFAKTNALMTGAVVNVAISNILWRLESSGGSPPFQTAAGMNRVSNSLMSWSQPVTLMPGTNVFASCVQYVNGQTSWTNRVTLVYDGPATGVAPAVTSPPLGQSVQVGASLNLSVGASGTEPLSYLWFKDGVALSETGPALSLASVLLPDAGDYSVVVANDYGSVTSAVATVTVTRLPVVFEVANGGLQASNGLLHLDISGLAQAGPVILYASTNLVDWEPIFTNSPVLGSWQYQDVMRTYGATFYRISETQ